MMKQKSIRDWTESYVNNEGDDYYINQNDNEKNEVKS